MCIRDSLCVIPNLAIHFNREVNKGYAYNPQVDLLPLFSGGKGKEESLNSLKELCAGELGVDPQCILASDLYLYNRESGRRMGVNGEFIGSPRLDDLQCAFGTLEGFLAAGEAETKCQEKGDAGCCAAVSYTHLFRSASPCCRVPAQGARPGCWGKPYSFPQGLLQKSAVSNFLSGSVLPPGG